MKSAAMKFFGVFLTFFLFFPAPVFLEAEEAEESEKTALLRVLPFKMADINPGEGKMIESLIMSYISDISGVTVYRDVFSDAGEEGGLETGINGASRSLAPNKEGANLNEPEVSMPPAQPDYVLSGKISMEDGRYVLSLDFNDNTNEGASHKVLNYKTTSEMALNVRSIVEEYFKLISRNSKDINLEKNDADTALFIRVPALLGTWQGDNGIEIVRFFPGRRALAVFSSGERMELDYKIESKTLYLAQISENNFRYYHPLPEEDAKILSAKAEPMRWEMQLFQNGKVLRGFRISSDMESTEGAVNIIKSSIKKSRWIKLSN